ncbi:MAG: hypothetical protein WD934_00830 [Gemmatimonadales bacterium]
MSTLALPLADLNRMEKRMRALAEPRPAIYRMVDRSGRVVYVGKARRLRQRLLSYFRARPPEKAARILEAAADIQWDYAPSEFAACLGELRQIRKFRPWFNVHMNRTHRVAFVRMSVGPAPRLSVGPVVDAPEVRHYGPFRSVGRLRDSVRVLNDQLGLRDCAERMPIVYAEQGDLFSEARHAACMRHAFGTCAGPCAGLVTETDYHGRAEAAVAFLEGRAAAPLDRVVAGMQQASDRDAFEQATRWRDRFDALEWLFGAANRIRTTIAAMTFVYVDPGSHGDDHAYIIVQAAVKASAPAPRTPIEHAAFLALVHEHATIAPNAGPLPTDGIDEMLLLLSWFRRHPAAMRKSLALDAWIARHGH